MRDDLAGWRIEMAQLLNNAHLRLVTVGDIEIHLQELTFNAIECDEVGRHMLVSCPPTGHFSVLCWQCATCSGPAIGEQGAGKASPCSASLSFNRTNRRYRTGFGLFHP